MKLFEVETDMGSIFVFAEDREKAIEMVEEGREELAFEDDMEYTVKEVTVAKLIIEAGYCE